MVWKRIRGVSRWGESGDFSRGRRPAPVTRGIAIACAEFHHAHAHVLVDTGDIDRAKAESLEAVELWLPIRLEITEDPLPLPLRDSMATEWP